VADDAWQHRQPRQRVQTALEDGDLADNKAVPL